MTVFAGGGTVQLAPVIALLAGLTGFLTSIAAKSSKAGDASIVAAYIFLVILSAVNEEVSVLAYICSVALLALRDVVWLSLESGRAAAPVIYRFIPLYTSALLVLVPSLAIRNRLPEDLSRTVVLVAIAGLLLYIYDKLEKIKENPSASPSTR